MIFTTFSRRALTAASLAAIFVPQVSFAATTQQMLDASLKAYSQDQAMRIAGTMNFDFSQRALRKDYQPTSGNIYISFNERSTPPINNAADNEGSITLEKLKFTGTNAGSGVLGALESLELPQPIRISWKKVAHTSYINIENLPPTVLDLAKSLEIDLAPFLNTWISIDITQFEAALKSQETISATTMLDAKKLVAFKQPLRALWVDSRKTNAKGEKIVRLRVGVNPALIAQAQNAELKAVDPKALDRVQLRTAINKRYADLRKTLNRFAFIAQINQTTGLLERLEAGGVQTEPKKDCTWNFKLERDVCLTTHMQTVKTAVGISFLKDSGAPIQAPAISISYNDLLKQIEEKMKEANSSTTPVTTQ